MGKTDLLPRNVLTLLVGVKFPHLLQYFQWIFRQRDSNENSTIDRKVIDRHLSHFHCSHITFYLSLR